MERLVYDRMNDLEATHWWFRARRDIISRVIARLPDLPPDADILEAGCGTGGNLQMLRSFGEVDAFEFDPQARAIAARKSNLDVHFGALPDDIPFANKAYDLIGLFDVLEHIDDDGATLRRLGERLKPNGTMVVTVPALPWLWSRHDLRHHHFRRYTRSSLKQTAERAGLGVEESFYFNALLLPVAIVLRAIKSVLRRETPDDTMPPRWLNAALHRVFSSERHLVGRLHMPVGLSVAVILKRHSAP